MPRRFWNDRWAATVWRAAGDCIEGRKSAAVESSIHVYWYHPARKWRKKEQFCVWAGKEGEMVPLGMEEKENEDADEEREREESRTGKREKSRTGDSRKRGVRERMKEEKH